MHIFVDAFCCFCLVSVLQVQVSRCYVPRAVSPCLLLKASQQVGGSKAAALNSSTGRESVRLVLTELGGW